MHIRAARRRTRDLAVLPAIALLAACASAPAPEPQRTFERVRVEQLYPVTRDVFAAAGLTTVPCHAAAVCLETSWSWRAYDAGALRERRKYAARYVRPALQNEYLLFLDLVVEERPAAGGEWVGKRVVPEDDPEYRELLSELDRVVWHLGGRESRNPAGATGTRTARRAR